MGKDAFGTARFGCKLCACSDYISVLESMPEHERDSLEGTRNTLTCQRKSELVLWCACEHAAWEHASTPEGAAVAARARTHDASDADELSTLLRSAELLHLAECLGAAGITLGDCFAHLVAGRVPFLAALRTAGVEVLKDRQAVVNACSKARRDVSRTIGAASELGACFDGAAFPAPWPYYAGDFELEAGFDPAFWKAAPFATHLREATASLAALCAGWLHEGAHRLSVGEHLAALNARQALPYEDGAFEAILCAAAAEYLTAPREAFAECHRVLRPGGLMLVLGGCHFGSAATKLWREADADGRQRVVPAYFHYSPRGGWTDVTVSSGAQPAEFVVRAQKQQ